MDDKKISSQLYFPTSYNAREMIQMSAECNCKVQHSMTHMGDTQAVEHNNTHSTYGHTVYGNNIPCVEKAEGGLH